MNRLQSFVFLSSCIGAAVSISITNVQGPAYQSPLAGQSVQNVTGIVTAKVSTGFYLQGDRSDDVRVSNGIFIYSTFASVLDAVNIGDQVSLGGVVSEFRTASSPNNLLTTEITYPVNVTVLSSNNTVTPIVLGKDRSPPTELLSALDVGGDGFLSVPNNSTLLTAANSTLDPSKYGLDFWESLEGQLVTVPAPVALGFPNNYGEFWVHGDWPVTGKNSRGGLTVTIGPDNIPDANPEVIIIGSPIDKTKNPKVTLGMTLSDITGVVVYQFGFFYVLPYTAPTILTKPDYTIAPTALTSKSGDSCITFGDYNVENMSPTSSHLPTVASHIVNLLKTPDIMFLQEIQDNSGPKDDGTVDANVTLSTLVNAITKISNVTYSFVEVIPVDGQDGGQPGGNIRQAYLYRPERLKLAPGAPAGGSLDAVQVVGPFGKPELTFNPGRIEPMNGAWNASRKPLAAHWHTSTGEDLFTVNVHFGSKGGSSSTQGDARPPVNEGVDIRTNQIGLVADFATAVLAKSKYANIIVSGDFNEFLQTRTAFKSIESVLTDIDVAVGIPPEERYSYVFDQNSQQLDHAFISGAIKSRTPSFDHVHVNTWAPSLAARISDHDPSVGRVCLC